MPFTKLAIKKAVKGIRKRATGFVLLAILFLVVGVLQDAFVSYQIRRTTRLELNESADEISNEIYKNDKWDLVSYRQVFIPSISSWYVFSADGFLNSEGGVLFIGINDNRTVRGIKEDLGLFDSSTDKFLLQIRDLITDRIGAEFAPLIKIHCESVEGKIVCVIEVEKAIEPAFLKGDNRNHFYTREGPRTNELDPKETNAFIRTKRWDD